MSARFYGKFPAIKEFKDTLIIAYGFLKNKDDITYKDDVLCFFNP